VSSLEICSYSSHFLHRIIGNKIQEEALCVIAKNQSPQAMWMTSFLLKWNIKSAADKLFKNF